MYSPLAVFTRPELPPCEAPAGGLEELEAERLELDELSVVELALVEASAFDDGWASEAGEADESEDADEVESIVERRFSR